MTQILLAILTLGIPYILLSYLIHERRGKTNPIEFTLDEKKKLEKILAYIIISVTLVASISATVISIFI